MKTGDKADIYNATPEGSVVLEGTATLIRKFERGHLEPYERWLVHFDGDDVTDNRERLVHPDNLIARKEG